jgi:hypothetical protein
LRFYCRGVDDSINREHVAVPKLEIRLADRAEVLTWADRMSMSPTQITHSFAVGDLFFGALLDGRLVHLSWLARKTAWLPDLYAIFSLDQTEAYLANTFTLPEARGRGIQPAVFQFIFRHESSLSIRRQFGYVRRSNHAGTRGFQKHGTSVRIWTMQCCRVRGMRGCWIGGIDQPGLPHMTFPSDFTTQRMGRMGLWLKPPPGRRMSWTMVPPSYGS